MSIYFHFLSSRNAIADLERKMIRVSRIVNLNDLFELRPYLLIDREKRKRLEDVRSRIAETHGMVCFSNDWHEPLLWGHYADRNRGIALGFEVISKRYSPTPVKYPPNRQKDPFGNRKAISEAEYIAALGYTKYSKWDYESEHRFFVKLSDCTIIEGDYYLPFGDDLALRSVLLGPEHPYKNRKTHLTLAAYLVSLVKGLRADIVATRAERKGFRIVTCGLWTPRFKDLMNQS